MGETRCKVFDPNRQHKEKGRVNANISKNSKKKATDGLKNENNREEARKREKSHKKTADNHPNESIGFRGMGKG